MMYEADRFESGAGSASLEDYIESIKSRWWLVVSLALLGLLAALLIYNARTLTYRAAATVLVNPTPVGSTNPATLDRPNLDREVEVIVSDEVAQAAAILLETDEDPLQLRRDIEASFIPASDIIRIEFVAGEPERAAEVVNAFATSYVSQRVEAQANFYTTRLNDLATQAGTLSTSLTTLAEQIADLDRQIEIARAANNTGDVTSLTSQRTAAFTDQQSASAQLRINQTAAAELEVRRNSESPAATVIKQALLPTLPQGLSRPIYLTAGLVLGLMVGIIAAFLSSRLDRSADNEVEVTRALRAPVMGSIPNLGFRNSRGSSALVMVSDQKTVRLYEAREAYRRLRAAVEFLLKSGETRTILITSAHPSEGKSVTSANLAVALATSGSTVVLVNADMRRPSLEQLFGTEIGAPGLSTYLGGLTDELPYVRIPELPNLVLVPAGPSPSNPGELLNSPRFQSLVKEISEQTDVLIIDTPPMGATADSAAVAQMVDGVLVVVDAKSASTGDLALVRGDLDRVGANVVGAVMNRDSARRGGFMQRRNRYAYGKVDARKDRVTNSGSGRSGPLFGSDDTPAAPEKVRI